MGKLQEQLNNFQYTAGAAYQEIMDTLEDKYCWKCPMRSTSRNSHCREIHSMKVLQEALDQGIREKLGEKGVSSVLLESLNLRTTQKRFKKQGGAATEKTIIMDVSPGQNQDLDPGTRLMVKINPRKIHEGEQIMIPCESIESSVLGACAIIMGFPFRVMMVERFFHENNFWYVEVENKKIFPLESILGVLIKVIRKDQPEGG
jgi:hypothetical protein